MKQKKQICLNKSVLDFMESVLTPKSRVLEFGGGWSSRWFADRCKDLMVIETSSKWAQIIKKELTGTRGQIMVPRIGLLYVVDVATRLKGLYEVDLVLIDCVEGLRHAATKLAWYRIKQGGWIVFDDAQRTVHRPAITWLSGRVEAGEPMHLLWQPGDVETATERVALAWQKSLE